MENKELKEELEKALTIVRDCWSNDNEIDYQLENIEEKIMRLIKTIA